VAQAGSPREVYDRPATPFVASFVGGANVLQGTVLDGHLSVGTGEVRTLADDSRSGAAVHAFVRPHDVKVTKASADASANDPRFSVARVERLAWLGAYVKLSLKLTDGVAMTVELPRGEIDTLHIAEGDLVMADLRQARVFIEDYSI
jgi:sulfate transport system ATP-binding protein